MEGINIRKIAKERGNGYRCLVEAVIDHKMIPEDPLTDTILKGAQGVAYDFWFWDENWREVAVSVNWEGLCGHNYFERYRRKNEVEKPITEIKFVREFMPDEKMPEKNFLLKRNTGSSLVS